ncbi:MAG TPA: ecotin family protein [Edaphocola sp.]|nr:ecotin family protein [Edaphocola sp.]
MKNIIAIFTLGVLSINTSIAQLPKELVGKTFYNTDLVNMDPRFGSVPRIQLESKSKAAVQKGDVVEIASIKKIKNGFITTTQQTKRSDTFEIIRKDKKDLNIQLKDQKGHLWVTKVENSTSEKELKNYPTAKEGMKRWVINLPSLPNEGQYKVEIYAGNLHDVDCNNFFLSGKIETKALEGFGYHYYNVSTDNKVLSTMKACPDNIKYRKFVHMKPLMVDYNSKLPLVIYTPADLIVRYKVFSEKEGWEYAFPK